MIGFTYNFPSSLTDSLIGETQTSFMASQSLYFTCCMGCPCPGAGGGAAGASVRSGEELPRAGSGWFPNGPTAAAAAPVSDAGGVPLKTRVRKGKMLPSSEGEKV